MDFQNRVGHKHGSGAPATEQDMAQERRERMRKLAMETIDLSKDPYIKKNHLGQIECRLCLTLHPNEANYLSHTQGRKHQTHLNRRLLKEKMELQTASPAPRSVVRKGVACVRIGRPGYKVTKLRCPETARKGLLFEVDYPEISVSCRSPVFCHSFQSGALARHRFMSAWEQKIDTPDGDFQYVIFAAEPYESIAFKIPNLEIDQHSIQIHWDSAKMQYALQVLLK
ncbi:MAG: hypothetical protein KVP17_000685 [Porospora cf. gigantea B]|uniref:uncharacterized protein n=1 Tax=Porospora cf. gigantea B TaxID=2853592 RepID=UPI0035718346|nr:MAG: hypothetical protein KVP17_000685 [Porospora cf. gigantea B]